MKGIIVILLVIIAAGVGYLAYSELQNQNAVDEIVDRIIRSRVADGIRATGGPKAAITEYYNDFDRFPTSFNEAGVLINPATLPDHIQSVDLGEQGKIVVSYNPYSLSLPPEVSIAILTIVPEPTDSGRINWSCVPSVALGRQRDILPAACRP